MVTNIYAGKTIIINAFRLNLFPRPTSKAQRKLIIESAARDVSSAVNNFLYSFS